MANLFVASSLACALLFLPVTSLMAQLVNLGVLTDVSGIYSTLSGEGSAEAARMAVEDFGGTVLGREVKVFLGDHRANVVTAADIATEWFDNNEVGIIPDMPNSTIALGMQKLAADRGKVSVTVSAGSTDLTGKQCRDTAFHWAYDTYSNTMNLERSMVDFGLSTWFFITADYSFGWTMEEAASKAVTAAGGRVLGSVRHPLNAATLAPLLVFITDVDALGLEVAQGMTFIDGFYWDRTEETRRWSKRFFDRRPTMPTMAHAGVYSAALHYLRAVQAAGTDDGQRVAAKMHELPVEDFFAEKGEVRANGRMAHDMYLVQVKRPEAAEYAWDYYKILATIPGKVAFQPATETGCRLVTR